MSQSTIKHNVKSLITSPSKLPHSMPQLEAMERAKYEENKPARHTSVVNSTSVLRSTHQEAGKSQHSPGMYEDANARRTPVNYSTNPVSRGSPMLGRAPEGIFHNYFISSPIHSLFSATLITLDKIKLHIDFAKPDHPISDKRHIIHNVHPVLMALDDLLVLI